MQILTTGARAPAFPTAACTTVEGCRPRTHASGRPSRCHDAPARRRTSRRQGRRGDRGWSGHRSWHRRGPPLVETSDNGFDALHHANLGHVLRCTRRVAAGVINLTQTAAVELGPHGIRVNALAPDVCLTEGLTAMMTPEAESRLDDMVPLGRPGHVDDTGRRRRVPGVGPVALRHRRHAARRRGHPRRRRLVPQGRRLGAGTGLTDRRSSDRQAACACTRARASVTAGLGPNSRWSRAIGV